MWNKEDYPYWAGKEIRKEERKRDNQSRKGENEK